MGYLNVEQAQQKVGNGYKIIEQAGREGSFSISFKAQDSSGNLCVVKFVKDKDFIKQKKESCNKYLEVMKSYRGEVKFPQPKFENGYFVEEFLGTDYPSNPHRSKEDLEMDKTFGKKLGDVIAYIHNYETNAQPSRIKIYDALKEDLNKTIKQMGDKLTKEQYDNVIEWMHSLKEMNTDDEVETYTHRDARTQNVLLNEDRTEMALIDFDMFGKSNIYLEFAPGGTNSTYPSVEFMYAFLDEHNNKCKYKINIDKFILMYKLRCIDEYARCAIGNEENTKAFPKNMERLWDRFEKIDEVFKSSKFTKNRAGEEITI